MRDKLIALVKKWTEKARGASLSDDERNTYYACAEELHTLCGIAEPEAECWNCKHESDSFYCQECIHEPITEGRESRFEPKDNQC